MNIEAEIWKDVPNYEGYYQVSNYGRVKSLPNSKGKKEKYIKGTINMDGYCQITLCKNNVKKNFTAHALVVFVFVGHVYKSHESVIDHIDNVKTNNALSNLQVISTRENTSKDKKKVINCTSKYTGVSWYKSTNRWVASYGLNGKTNFIGYYKCEIEASKAYQNTISTLKG